MAAVTGIARPASASLFTIDIVQDGSNVVATGTGSIDISVLSLQTGVTTSGGFMNPGLDILDIGSASGVGDLYSGAVSGPADFGSGGAHLASASIGDVVGISAADLVVPDGYVSDAALSGDATWDNATFSSLGLTTGTYTWTWDSGADSLVVNIGATGVPEPASLTLLASALLGLGAARRRRKA
ncbi:MAG TPA: VPLPA-CTERM sorting domain-containing protein [Stellaceae bacterium]|nr:VPLPA-CTERM sorting domain-containing protein [Stellaceae bacterium]